MMTLNGPPSDRRHQLRKYAFASPLFSGFIGRQPLTPIPERAPLESSLSSWRLPGYISSDETEGEGCSSSDCESDSEVERANSPAILKGGWYPAEIIESSDDESEPEGKDKAKVEVSEPVKDVLFSRRRR